MVALADEHVDALVLFNERVARLESTALATHMQRRQYEIAYEKVMNRQWVAEAGMTQDDVDAFVLNLRLLIRDTDGFSIRCLQEIYDQADTVPARLRQEFNELRGQLKRHLASSSLIKRLTQAVLPNDSPSCSSRCYSNEELFDIITYGLLAHVNRRYFRESRLLTQAGAFSAFVFMAFFQTLQTYVAVTKGICDLNKRLLNHTQHSEESNS